MTAFEYLDEINLAVVDKTLAAALRRQHDNDLAPSVELLPASWRRSVWEKSLAQAVWIAAGQRRVRRLGGRPRV